MREADCLVIGASFAGAGFAAAAGKDVVIVENTCVLGKEFAAGLNQKPAKKMICKTKQGKNLENELKRRGLLNENGEIYAQPAVFVLSKLLLELKTEVRFHTVVTNIEHVGSGFEITLFNNEGISKMRAKQVIDTTSAGVFGKHKRRKFLCSAVAGQTELRNEITGMAYIALPLEESCGWMEAREKTLAYVQKNNLKIVMMANEFAYRDSAEPKETEGILWLPSDGFYNLLEAFEGGAAVAEQRI